MDKCIYKGKVINSFDIAADIDLEMEIRQCDTLQCCDPECNAPVRYKHGKIRIPYFAHLVTNKECDYDRYSSKKSDVFKKVQHEIYDVLKRKYPQAVDIDIKLIKEPPHYTPIILKGRKSNFAIDITDKQITAKTLQSRKEAYAAFGYIGMQMIIDEAANCELSESTDLYLPVRYELNKSSNHSTVVYDKSSKKYYYLFYDSNEYNNAHLRNNVISREFTISELSITAKGISVPRLDNEFSEWTENRKNSHLEYLESLKKVEAQRLHDAEKRTKKAENKIIISKPSFDPIEYHKQTGKYAGMVINGVRKTLSLNEIHIKKNIDNHFNVFSDSKMEELINDAFDFSVENILKLLNKMYKANEAEKAVFVRIYEEYLNTEQTEEVCERLKILEYAIQEAEIFS